MKCERCGKELSDVDLYCPRCGKAVFEKYMDEEDVWVYYKSDEELARIMREEEEIAGESEENSDMNSLEIFSAETEVEAEEENSETFTEDSQSLKEKTEEGVMTEEVWETEEEEPDEISEKFSGGIENEIVIETGEDEADQEETEIFPETIHEREAASAADSQEDDLEDLITVGEEGVSEHPALYEEEESLEDSSVNGKEGSSENYPVLYEGKENQDDPAVSEGESREGLSASEDTEEELDEEDDEFEEEEADEEESYIPPEERRTKRYAAAVSCIFLAVCLCIGLYLGYLRIRDMEEEERDYYNNLNTVSQEETQTDGSTEQTEDQTNGEDHNFKLEDADSVDLSQYNKLTPAGVTGDSEMHSENYDYGPEQAADGDIESSWQEGESGLGEGKSLKINLDGSHKIRYIVLYLGNWRSDEMWGYNARPHELTLQIGDVQKDVEFTDEKKKFCLSLETPINGDSVSITLKSVYKGTRWEDTCISEIELYEEK